jgi:hypothetical protein
VFALLEQSRTTESSMNISNTKLIYITRSGGLIFGFIPKLRETGEDVPHGNLFRLPEVF